MSLYDNQKAIFDRFPAKRKTYPIFGEKSRQNKIGVDALPSTELLLCCGAVGMWYLRLMQCLQRFVSLWLPIHREPVSFAKARCSCGSILPESIGSGILAAFAPSEAKQHTAGGLAAESIRFRVGRVRRYISSILSSLCCGEEKAISLSKKFNFRLYIFRKKVVYC